MRKVRAAQSTTAVNGRQAVMFGHCYRDENCETSILWAAIPSIPTSERCSRETSSTFVSSRHRWRVGSIEARGNTPPEINGRHRFKRHRTRLIGLSVCFASTNIAISHGTFPTNHQFRTLRHVAPFDYRTRQPHETPRIQRHAYHCACRTRIYQQES